MSALRTNRIYRLAAAGRRRPSIRNRPPSPENSALASPTPAPQARAVNSHAVTIARVPASPAPAAQPAVAQVTKTLPRPTASWATPRSVTPKTTESLSPSNGKRRWTAWRVARWIGLGMLAAVVAYGIWVYAAFENMRNRIYEPLLPSPTPHPAWAIGTATALSIVGITPASTTDPYQNLPAGRLNILLLGSDKRPDYLGMAPRSDTLILVNLDTQTRVVRMLTIPRDLAVEIPGYTGLQKINAAYFLGEQDRGPGGGQALAVETVSELFDVPIDYYVMINFEGFRTLIDTLGGIVVNVPTELDDWNYPSEDPNDPFAQIRIHFDAGLQTMDGQQALRYARTRHADNDFARSKRQLQVIMAIKEKATSLDLITKIPGLLDQLSGMIETNIPPDKQIPLLQAGYDLNPSNIITASIGFELITAIRLPDRSEGLSLNWRKAGPVLDRFFGRGPTVTPTRTPRRTPTARLRSTRTPTTTPMPRRPLQGSTTPLARPTLTATPRVR